MNAVFLHWLPSRFIYTLFLFLLGALPVQGAGAERGAPVSVDEARERAIYREVQLTGTVTSPRIARLSAATEGLVVAVHADEGTRVAAGDVLLKLDAELAELQWKSTLARSEQARQEVADAKRRLNEARALIPQRSIAESSVRDLEAEVELDQTALQQAETDARFQRALLDRHTLKAPYTGVVSNKLTEHGEWVTPGQSVFELVAIEDLRLDFSVSEDYLAHIGPDTSVTFKLNAKPDHLYTGHIGTVVPVTDPGARTFLLRVLIDNADETVIPGMSVQATLHVPAGRNGVVVPRDAILRYPDGRVVVWTLDTRDGNLVARESLVRTGLRFDNAIEVLSGITSGARVVVQGNESLQNGQHVYITSPK